MTEHSFIRSINNLLRQRLFIWKIDAASANGTPDCWYSGDKADLWVEYKYGTAHPISRLQNRWLTQRHNEGRTCWAVAGVGDLVSIIKEPPYDVLSPLVTRAVLLSEINKHCLHCNEDERMTTPKNGRKGRDIPLNSNELTAAENLRRIWAIKKKEMDLTQAKLAGGLGVGQSLISQYLNGFIPLNVKMILEFSRLLEVDPIEIAPHMMDIIEAARHGNTLRQNAVITKEGRTVILLEPKDIPGWSVPTPTARAILVERRVGEDCPAGTTVIYDTAVELPRDVITSKRNSLFVVETPGKSAGLRLARLQDDSLADAETAAVICALDDLDKVKVRPVIAKMCLTGV